jgi:sugar phosphate isomerase/epimerase
MSLRRCFSSLGCAELSLDATLALADRHGIGCVELRALGGSADLPGYFSTEFGTPARLAAHLARSDVQIAALNTGWRLVGSTRPDQEQLTALAPWADALGVAWLRVFDGGKDATASELAEAGQALQWWRTLRQQRGWRTDVLVETHDSLLTAGAITRFTRAFPDSAILWDSHHTWRKGGEDPVVTWRAIQSTVAHVHVKDSINVPSARHPFTYVLPGDGEFPMAALVSVLRADGFEGPVSLEWEKMWHPYLPTLDDALTTAASREWW